MGLLLHPLQLRHGAVHTLLADGQADGHPGVAQDPQDLGRPLSLLRTRLAQQGIERTEQVPGFSIWGRIGDGDRILVLVFTISVYHIHFDQC